jgi:hypothetical protein
MSAKKAKRGRRAASEQKNNSGRNILIGGAIALGIIGLGVLLYMSLQEPESLDGLRRVAGLSRSHDESVDYSSLELPPVGGVHSGIWQNCGIYDQPVVSKNAVHSMEHGAVWITYQPDLPAGDVTALQDMVRDQNFVVLSPYPDLKSPVVLSAWGILLEIDSADDSRIANFVNQYQQGPQTPELGAICTDGTGSPIN